MRIYGNHTENPCRYTTKRDRHETIDEADNDLGFRSFGYILYLKKTNKKKKYAAFDVRYEAIPETKIPIFARTQWTTTCAHAFSLTDIQICAL